MFTKRTWELWKGKEALDALRHEMLKKVRLGCKMRIGFYNYEK
jgi:hypothetical protein